MAQIQTVREFMAERKRARIRWYIKIIIFEILVLVICSFLVWRELPVNMDPVSVPLATPWPEFLPEYI